MNRAEIVPLAALVVVLVVCALIIVLAHRSRHGYREGGPTGIAYVAYGKAYPDGHIDWYPSPAAYRFDPVWSRGGCYTVACNMIDGVPVTPPTRVYPADLKALRRED